MKRAAIMRPWVGAMLAVAAGRVGPLRGALPSMSVTQLPWRSSLARVPELGDWKAPLDAALKGLDWGRSLPRPDVALLVIPRAYTLSLQEACAIVARTLSPAVCVGVIGAGAIGGHEEVDSEPALCVTAGTFPAKTTVTPFVLTRERMPLWSQLAPGDGARPAFLLLADPFSAISQAAAALDEAYPASVVAGGLSCPSSDSAPSLALYTRGARCRALPIGSVVGLCIRGPHTEVHTVCAQGAAPVGPAFEVTKARNNLVLELGGRPAVERLTEVARSLEGDKRTLALLRRKGVACWGVL